MKLIKKQAAALTLGAAIIFSGTAMASANGGTYQIKSGDTLTKIAKQHGLSLSELMKMNNLTSTTVNPGIKLVVSKGSTSTATKTVATTNSTYTVKAGDSLSKIAKIYGTTSTKLKELNGLNSTVIKIGQKLKVSGTNTVSTQVVATTTKTTATTTAATTSSADKLVNVAQKYLGVRYTFGGSSPTLGFDCSGFVYYTYKTSGYKNISRNTAAGYYNMSKKVSSPVVGDLVFFSNTYKKGISHVGIYIGNGKMINASGNKVQIESFSSGYWASKFTGYGRL